VGDEATTAYVQGLFVPNSTYWAFADVDRVGFLNYSLVKRLRALAT
jgi:hypothetical protein